MFFGLFDPVIKENYWTKNGFIEMDVLMPIRIFMMYSGVETAASNKDDNWFTDASNQLKMCIIFSREARLDKSVQTFYELCLVELTRRYTYTHNLFVTLPCSGPLKDKYAGDAVETTSDDIFVHGTSYNLKDRNLNPIILKNYLKIIDNYVLKKRIKYTKVVTGSESASMLIPDMGITFVDFNGYNQLFKILSVSEKIRPPYDIISGPHSRAGGKIPGEKVSRYYTSDFRYIYIADFSHDSDDRARRDKIRNSWTYTFDFD